jgi:hypothetical protein
MGQQDKERKKEKIQCIVCIKEHRPIKGQEKK